MSVTHPLVKIKKFYNYTDRIVAQLMEQMNSVRVDNEYVRYKPHKHSTLFIGVNDGIENMSFNIEVEYNDVLLIFFKKPNYKDDIEYEFAFEWTEEEIELGSPCVDIPIEIQEEELFQLSLVEDLQFLSFEIHKALIDYCNHITKALQDRINEKHGL